MDPTLQKASYTCKKQQLAELRGAAGVNERLLFHERSFSNSEATMEENFRLDQVGSTMGNPGLYGRGIYFADDVVVVRGFMNVHYSRRSLLVQNVLVGRANAVLTPSVTMKAAGPSGA